MFYLFFVAALIFFVVDPAVVKGSWFNALLFGAFFGFICYATYDLTNQATIKDWPLLVTIVDLAWGTFFSAIVSLTTYFIYQKFF